MKKYLYLGGKQYFQKFLEPLLGQGYNRIMNQLRIEIGKGKS